MSTAELNGTTIYYEVDGQGPPCLVLHGGLGVDHQLYRRTLAPLGRSRRLVFYDHRGNGRSGRPPLDTITIPQLADDALALAHHLGFERFAVLGHSYGGFVAQELALRHGEHVDKLVLVATTPGQPGAEERAEDYAADTPRTAEAVRQDEPTLVDWAATKEWRSFFREVAYWEHEHDPDGPEPRHERRTVNLSRTFDGCWALDGWFDPISGTIVHSELARLEQRLFQADWHDAKARLGRDPSLLELARTPGQRRADALVEMAHRSATAPADGKRPRPLVSFVVGVDAFARMCELLDGTVVRPAEVAPLLERERIVFDGPDRPIATSPQRRFTGTLRRILDIRDRGCTHPFCDEPPDRCQGDHIQPWADGGITTIGNGRLRCDFHNRLRNQRPPPEAA